MKRHSIQVLAHQELTEADLGELRQLFDSEYLKEFGEWDPQQPYGYASHDVHIMVRIEGRIVAGQRRRLRPPGRISPDRRRNRSGGVSGRAHPHSPVS